MNVSSLRTAFQRIAARQIVFTRFVATVTVPLCLSCASEPDRLNVLLLVPDTVRGDHLSVNGYPEPTSPRLDALTREGTDFSNAITAAPRTWQSFLSILTGLYPPHHGVRFIHDHPLPARVESMATRLGAAGYETAAFDTLSFLPEMTARRGFDRFIIADRSRETANIDETMLFQVWEWISTPREKPFFAFVRLAGAHWPYDQNRFIDAFYDESNQKYSQHGPRVDDAVMRVPLIVRLPKGYPGAIRGQNVEDLVRTVDILPTVLHAVGVAPPQRIDGVSLLPLIRGETLPKLWAYGEAGRSFMGLDKERYFPGVRGKHRNGSE